jgi:SepF-like predicted cell division protein (DUF552 family)
MVNMGFLSWFKKEDQIPVSSEKHTKTMYSRKNRSPSPLGQKAYIKQISLRNIEDLRLLQRNLMAGNIMVVNLEPLVNLKPSNKSMLTLQSQLAWFKHYCLKFGGSVGRLHEYVFIVTPNRTYEMNN